MTPEEQRQKKNQESLESYNWYKAHHVCVRCRNASATDGFVTCQKCREAINAGHRFWYAALTPERKKKGQAKKQKPFGPSGVNKDFAPAAAESEKTSSF